MNKLAQVYVIFKVSKVTRSGNEFVGVFFDRNRAEDWIKYQPIAKQQDCRYFVVQYEQPVSGVTEEVFD
jgi:hypothetical protein